MIFLGEKVKNIIINFTSLFTALLVGFKLSNIVARSWVCALLPLWVVLLLLFLWFLIMAIVLAVILILMFK